MMFLMSHTQWATVSWVDFKIKKSEYGLWFRHFAFLTIRLSALATIPDVLQRDGLAATTQWVYCEVRHNLWCLCAFFMAKRKSGIHFLKKHYCSFQNCLWPWPVLWTTQISKMNFKTKQQRLLCFRRHPQRALSQGIQRLGYHREDTDPSWNVHLATNCKANQHTKPLSGQ